MSLPEKIANRVEAFLNNIAGGGADLPEKPRNNIERYLDYIARNGGGGSALPERPRNRIERYLDYIARNGGGGGIDPSDLDYYKTIQLIVRAGLAADFFKVGDQILETWSDGTTTYDLPMDIVHIGTAVNADGETVPAMYLQSHYVLPNMAFDASEAIFVPTEDLPAGTYSFTFGEKWGSGAIQSGAVYRFTTTKVVPAGGQIQVCQNNEYSRWSSGVAANQLRVHTWADPSDILPLEKNLSLTSGAGTSTSLGTLYRNTKYSQSGLNNLERAVEGYNRWSQSGMRQWLNSAAPAGEWWTAQNPFDRAPENISTARGFLAGLNPDFLAVVSPIRVTTALNLVSDVDIGATETVVDRFFLASLQQEYFDPVLSGAEGTAWDYWVDRLDIANPQQRGTSYAMAEHIRYLVSDPSAKKGARMRSCDRTTAGHLWAVNSSGAANENETNYTYYPVPACVIC